MSILNVNQIQPVGSGQTVTISATNISAGSATVTAGTFSGNLSSSGISTFSDTVNVGAGKSIRLYGATSGYSEIVAAAGSASTTFTLPANGGSASQYLQTDGSGVLSWQTVTDTTGWTWDDTGTALSGSSVSVTGIPSGARQIIVNFYDLSPDSGYNFFIRVGDSSGLASSGYFTRSLQFDAGSLYDTYFSEGWYSYGLGYASHSINGTITLNKLDGNKWHGVAFLDSGTTTDTANMLIGDVALSGTLDRVGLVMASGNFDAGRMFVHYLEP